MKLFPVLRLLSMTLPLLWPLPGGRLLAAPVEFGFRPAAAEGNPFSRDVWATIETPDGRQLQLPAFYDGDGRWAVRTRADQKGNYRFVGAAEASPEGPRPLAATVDGRDRVRVRDTDPLGRPITVDPRTGRDFVDGAGQRFLPLGGNLPWAPDEAVETYYPAAFADLRAADFNWTRIWMSHWGRLNLDWVEPAHGTPPPLGELSLEVARRWDRLVTAAETAGVRFQMVLQHHGQYTTVTNSNWDENPWNAVHDGGFLASPEDFFSDEQARRLTRDKYRYIVARWGYSSAIMAWELFNEVMWTNARRGDATTNAQVAAWHTEMARHLRRYDVHGHLVTTSDDDLRHPLWAAMDYYQPHLYGSHMVLGLQAVELAPDVIDRPVFYGEMGDDNMAGLSAEQRTTGAAHSVLAWSGLFAPGAQPAQMWYLETLRRNDRWPEAVSLGRFARAAGLHRHVLPHVARPLVLGGDDAPVRLQPGHYWHRGPNPELHVPLDGREPPELMAFRRILTNASATPPHPYPSRVTLHLDYPAAATARLDVARIANRGASLRLTLDGQTILDTRWPAATESQPAASNLSFPFRIGYGQHTLVIENPVGDDWIDLAGLDLGVRAPALAATVRYGRDRAVLWVRHRTQLLSPLPDEQLSPTAGTVQLTELPAGNWRVTWWDIATGAPSASSTVSHAGGALAVPTPSISRHGAAWLEKLP